MKKFIISCFLFLCIIVTLDVCLGNILRYFYFRQKTGFQYRIDFGLNHSKADVYILGSSRAMHHYDPRIVSGMTGLKCYNAGENGMDILFHSLMIKGILKRNTPKIIIIDLNLAEFRKSQVSYDRLSWLLPYYKDHKDFGPILFERSKTEKLKLLSQIYPFNSSILQVIYGNLPIDHGDSREIDGFIPLYGKWSKPIKIVQNKNQYEIDTFKIKKFEEILNLSKTLNFNIVVCVSPTFVKYDLLDKSLTMAKTICDNYNIPFFMHCEDSYFYQHPYFFKDPDHLNSIGAEVFTQKITNEILQKIRKKN